MTQTVFSIDTKKAASNSQGYFRVGVPCPQGKWPATASVSPYVLSGRLPNCFTKVTQIWPDGSIKWLHCEGLLGELSEITGDSDKFIAVHIKQDNIDPFRFKSPVIDTKEHLVVKLNNGDSITFDKLEFLSFTNNETFAASLLSYELPIVSNKSIEFQFTTQFSCEGYEAISISQRANLILQDGVELEAFLSATVFLCDGTIKGNVSFSNPRAALHPNGQWDLGDPHSVHLKEIALSTQVLSGKSAAVVNNEKYVNAKNECLSLYQASSGKENWRSNVHVNAQNIVPLHFKGFRLYREQEELIRGGHAVPHGYIDNIRSPINVQVEKFWQNAPSSMTVQKDIISLSLLGSRYAEPIELQPGEQKTREFSFSQNLVTNVEVSMSPDWVSKSNVMPFFRNEISPLNELIKEGIEGENSFFIKRDTLDEFGWRHFGEIYADHEKALNLDEDYFVSHYNNQYDPIFGMLYQWLITGEQRWFKLADDLARHVADIDVYHTSEDKPEYSGGMFWHTDHYVQAYTATHRTYSKQQPSDVYDDHAGGGGPGGQHCYTNGLTLHYLLTGYMPAKKAVLSIVNWISNYYEGDGTLLGALLSLKNSGAPGLKDVKRNKYPLDRGTGNYLQALLDRFELQGNLSDIEMAGLIIKHTASTDDNLDEYHLHEVESTWFYTVFLQAVCRFIAIKERLAQNDRDYVHAVLVLSHFARWMIQNEYAYLDKPEILEFPNQTWSGQDIRKLCVLNFASNYLSKDMASLAMEKVTELQRVIIERLSISDESKTTRVLCLMMQNTNYNGYKSAASPMYVQDKIQPLGKNSGAVSNVMHFAQYHVLRFSFKRERSQLVKRFPTFQKWLGRP